MDNTTFYKRNLDSVFFKKIILSILFIVIFSFITFSAIKSGNYLFLAAALSLPIIMSLMTRLDIAYVIMTILAATMIYIDKGNYLLVSTILMAYMILFLVLSICINSDIKKLYNNEYGSKYLIIFFIFTIIIMLVRGTGIRILGSPMWGGTAYILLLLSILFYVLVIPRIILSRGQIKFLIIASLIFSIVGAVFKLTSSTSAVEVYLARANWLTPVIFAMLPIIFASLTKRRKVLPILFFLICIILIMLTGYRSRLVMLAAVAFGFGYFKTNNKSSYLFKTLLITIVGWIIAIIIAPVVPDAMQRTLSFIPGVSINYQVALNAQDSNSWRIEIWSYAISEIKNYWLVGRGVAFNVQDAVDRLGITVGQGNTYQAFLTHTYHSGPITLLVDFGIPGLITAFVFMIFVFKKVLKIATQFSKIDLFEEQYFLFLCVSLMWSIFSFWFVFGDPRSLSKLLLLTAHVMIISNSLKKIYKIK